MRFYDRESELAELERIRSQAFADHSRFTVITGRRRIGKTSLILKSLEGTKFAYLFVSKKSEGVLCYEFIEELSKATGITISQEIRTLRSLFMSLFALAGDEHISIVIDEFQELNNINPAFFSDLQNLWDRNKENTKLNFIVSGSVYTLMHKLFQDKNEPLFGRADSIINLSPFRVNTLKEIMVEIYPKYKNEDLLAFYAITGGVPKYVELFCDNDALSIAKMLDFTVRENSPFLEEGRNLLIEEFGKNYATYFSILTAVAQGRNTQNEIQSFVGKTNLGGQLKRLVEEYALLAHIRPMFSKPTSKTVKYEIKDPFIRFWFRYVESYRPLVEMKAFDQLRKIVSNDFATFSGKSLEDFFKDKLALTNLYREIGSYWEPGKGDQSQIDIVALELENPRKALVAEVKRSKKEFRPTRLNEKAEHLEQKALHGYEITQSCLSLDDI
jgi:AAA+ ATPase superfamily predicted ATPase